MVRFECLEKVRVITNKIKNLENIKTWQCHNNLKLSQQRHTTSCSVCDVANCSHY